MGIKLILTPWTHIDIGISLGIIGVILVLAVIFSIWKAKQVELAAEKAESSRHPE